MTATCLSGLYVCMNGVCKCVSVAVLCLGVMCVVNKCVIVVLQSYVTVSLKKCKIHLPLLLRHPCVSLPEDGDDRLVGQIRDHERHPAPVEALPPLRLDDGLRAGLRGRV